MPEPPFSVHARDQVLEVSGEIDVANAPQLQQAAEQAFPPGTPFTLDLTAVTFADSSAISTMIGLRLRAGGTPAALRIRCSPVIERLFELTGLLGVFGSDGTVTT